MRDRAFRRDVMRRKKEWAKKIFNSQYWNNIREVDIGIRATSPKNCSCLNCGNPRKYHKQKETMQERKAPTY
jgi:hypothetical protein